MLGRLHIPRLDTRRKALRLCLLYKLIDHNSSTPQITSINWRSCPYETRLNHSRQLHYQTGHSSQYLNSFFPRTINEWNKLSNDIVSCTNVGSFKYPSICMLQLIVYIFKLYYYVYYQSPDMSYDSVI